MKALILYRSYHGNTREVAESLAREIRKNGNEAELRELRKRLPDLTGIDCVMIGAPTHMGRVTWKARRALKRLKRKGLGAKPLAVFDTFGPMPTDPEKLQEDEKWFHPGAVGRMAEKARQLGLNLYEKTLRCEVREWKGPLQEGELEKAAQFAREFVAAAGKS